MVQREGPFSAGHSSEPYGRPGFFIAAGRATGYVGHAKKGPGTFANAYDKGQGVDP
jgi:hypothetical protein